MKLRSRFLTDPGLLCSIIFTAACFIAAIAWQPQFGQSQPLVQQGAQQTKEKPDEPAAKTVVVTGTIVKKGSDYILRDPAGSEYLLDAPEKAEPFDGASVRVTGMLEANTNLLHVESIEPIMA